MDRPSDRTVRCNERQPSRSERQLHCRASPGKVQGMTRSIPHNTTGSIQAPVGDPIVASVGGVNLLWHARTLRGNRSIAEAARLVGLNRDELSRIEKGETTQIRFETLAKLLAGYDCDLADLLQVVTDVEEPRPRPLYASVVDALDSGVIERRVPGRRSIRRPTAADVVDEGDADGFAPSPDVHSARRRSAVGTANRPK